VSQIKRYYKYSPSPTREMRSLPQPPSNSYRLQLIGIALLIPTLVAAGYALEVCKSVGPVAGASAAWYASLALLVVILISVVGMLIACRRILLLPMRRPDTISQPLEALYAFGSFLADPRPIALARSRELLRLRPLQGPAGQAP
jgi:hypothetical protein